MTPDQWFALGQWLVGGAIGIGAVTAGAWGAWRFRGAQPRRPICTCGHGYGTHDGGHGPCGGKLRARRNYTDFLDPCPCRSYDGPDPLLIR